MTIKTEHDIGDYVYCMQFNRIAKTQIIKINTKVIDDGRVIIKYLVSHKIGGWLGPEELFDTKDSLARYLLEN